MSTMTSTAPPAGGGGYDCNDTNPSIFYGAPEYVADGIDSDCNGQELCNNDADNDGAIRTTYPQTIISVDLDCLDPFEGGILDPVDCNDNNAAIRPGIPEVVGSGADEDCNLQELCYIDADNDGARLTGTVVSADLDCNDSSEGVPSDPLDCNDANAAIRPGATETIANGIDDNCDGQESCHTDADNDGTRLASTVSSLDTDCTDPYEGIPSDPIDCDDTNALRFPGNSETVGNGVDNDCNSQELCYADADNDTARHGSNTLVSVDPDCLDNNEALATDAIDCDDTNALRFPGNTESVGDGIDSDCNSQELCYLDADDDNARTSSTFTSADADCLDAFEALAIAPLDCNDGDAAIQPGVAEITGDGIDQNCDAAETCFEDADNDDQRHATSTRSSTDADCLDVNEALTSATIDCDDTNAQRFFSNTESVGDGVDNDCDSVLDPAGCDPSDLDNDGLSNVEEETLCAAAGLDTSLCPNDPDVDDDAVIDSVEVGTDSSNPLDTDSDGLPDFNDSDDDGDGLSSRQENGLSCSGELEALYDLDAEYFLFACDGDEYDFGSNALSDYPDDDSDGLPNFLDAAVPEETGDTGAITDDTEDTGVVTDTDTTDTVTDPVGDTSSPFGPDPKPPAGEEAEGCGCASRPSSPRIALAVAVGLFLRRRRTAG